MHTRSTTKTPTPEGSRYQGKANPPPKTAKNHQNALTNGRVNAIVVPRTHNGSANSNHALYISNGRCTSISPTENAIVSPILSTFPTSPLQDTTAVRKSTGIKAGAGKRTETNESARWMQQFLFGETIHLQALMSKQIERDLMRGDLEKDWDEDQDMDMEEENPGSDMLPTLSAAEQFALPEPLAEDVARIEAILEKEIKEGGYVIASADTRFRRNDNALEDEDMDRFKDEGSVDASIEDLVPVVERPDVEWLDSRKRKRVDVRELIDTLS